MSELIFFYKYQNRTTISIIDLNHFTRYYNEELYSAKIGPNFVGSAVIRMSDYEKKQGPLINMFKNMNLKQCE